MLQDKGFRRLNEVKLASNSECLRHTRIFSRHTVCVFQVRWLNQLLNLFLRFKLLSLRKKFLRRDALLFFEETHACVRGTWCVFREHGCVLNARVQLGQIVFLTKLSHPEKNDGEKLEIGTHGT